MVCSMFFNAMAIDQKLSTSPKIYPFYVGMSHKNLSRICAEDNTDETQASGDTIDHGNQDVHDDHKMK